MYCLAKVDVIYVGNTFHLTSYRIRMKLLLAQCACLNSHIADDFSARVSANCRTSSIIYLIQCRKCKMQYVGETENSLHLRMNGKKV